MQLLGGGVKPKATCPYAPAIGISIELCLLSSALRAGLQVSSRQSLCPAYPHLTHRILGLGLWRTPQIVARISGVSTKISRISLKILICTGPIQLDPCRHSAKGLPHTADEAEPEAKARNPRQNDGKSRIWVWIILPPSFCLSSSAFSSLVPIPLPPIPLPASSVFSSFPVLIRAVRVIRGRPIFSSSVPVDGAPSPW
jgi:hypothetical protein